jgi:hypothetical protein
VGVVVLEITLFGAPPEGTPEASEAVALPLLAIGLLGTYWAISRRRRGPQAA